MPRKGRIDMFGGIHNLIIKEIKRNFLNDDQDRRDLLNGLGRILIESKATRCIIGR